MSNPTKIAGSWPIERCNAQIGQWLTPILPDNSNFPDTYITFHVADTRRERQPTITFAVEIECTPEEFSRLVMKGEKPKERDTDKLLLIGDEIVPGGLYVLYTVLESQMIRLKFATEAEALAYKNYYRLGQYEPIMLTKTFGGDEWFDGEFKDPDNYGLRGVSMR